MYAYCHGPDSSDEVDADDVDDTGATNHTNNNNNSNEEGTTNRTNNTNNSSFSPCPYGVRPFGAAPQFGIDNAKRSRCTNSDWEEKEAAEKQWHEDQTRIAGSGGYA
jgi:hypothetical protein